MARKRKQTKAQKEYTRIRKNITQYQRRHGTTYELPKTPTQALGKGKAKASDYKAYTKSLKQFYSDIKILESERKQNETTDKYTNFADVVIDNFKRMYHATENPEAKGIPVIDRWLNNLISSKGKIAVANMILEAQDKGGLQISMGTLYDVDLATQFTEDVYKFFKSTGMSKNDLKRLQEEAEFTERFYNF